MKKYLFGMTIFFCLVYVPEYAFSGNECDVEIGCSDDELISDHPIVKVLTYDEFIKIYESEQAFTLLDVRPEANYKSGHIQGAKSLFIAHADPTQIKQLIPQQNEKIIVYCSSSRCPMSHHAARKLMRLGYKDVLDYTGGIYEWIEKGHQPAVIPPKVSAAQQ